MPSPIHEILLSDFRDILNDTLHALPFDRHAVRVRFETNFEFKKLGYTTTPDLSLTLASYHGYDTPSVPILVECTFSQHRKVLWKELQKEIPVHPEITLLVLILVTETNFHGPEMGSAAWDRFQDKDEFPNAKSFLQLRVNKEASTTQAIAIDVADHAWCNISSTEYCVWVKNDDEANINVNREPTGRGTIFPSLEMEPVTSEIRRGFKKVRDSIATFSRAADPGGDTHELDNCDITFALEQDDLRRGLELAACLTAYDRYQYWIYNKFHGSKRARSDDEDHGYESVTKLHSARDSSNNSIV